ncbi:MAG: S8 family serine peptidase [Candidatus Kapaibacteriota bacterium]
MIISTAILPTTLLAQPLSSGSVGRSDWSGQASALAPQKQAPMRLVSAGKRLADGYYSLAKAFTVPDVDLNIEKGAKLSDNAASTHTMGLYLKTKQRIIMDESGVVLHEAVQAILSAYSVRSVRELPLEVRRVSAPPTGKDIFFTTILFTAPTDVRRLCADLEALSEVEYAEPMQTLQARQTLFPTPNDPLFSRQYHWQRIRAQEAWTLTRGDSSVVVAVCDTGVDWEHEDLAASIWTNPGESGRDAQGRDKRSNGVDDDANGKIDDWHGWDFVGAAREADLLQGRFREDNDPKLRFTGGLVPSELPNHGTHVAGSIAAQMNNTLGGTGIAPNCKLLPIKCGTDGDRIDGIYRGYEAILYAAQMGAKVIVCSFGGRRYSRFEQDIVNTATDMGALVVAAAGNSGGVTDNAEFPASYDNVLAVGSSNQADRATPSSDFGLLVDVFAPGESILSTATGNAYTDEFSGTSMATPMAAGVAALLRSRRPNLTPRQIIQQIRGTSDNTLLGAGSPSNRPLGFFGRLNALQALTASPAGLTVQSVSIGAATGVIQDVQPVLVRFSVLNVLTTAQNARIELRSLDGKAVAFEQAQTLGTMPTNTSQIATFSVQLTPTALQGTGLRTAEFVIVFLADNGYLNYERLSVPYNIRPSLGAQMLVSPLMDFNASGSAQALVNNAGLAALSLSNITISGANAADFSTTFATPFSLAASSSSAVPVRFSPQMGSIGVRTATLTLTAQPSSAPMLEAVAGGYEFSTLQAPYNEFSDGTPLFATTGIVDDVQSSVSIGFPFRFGGEMYQSLTVSSNGFVAFAPVGSLVQQGSIITRPLHTFVSAKGYIAILGADIVMPTTNTMASDVRLRTDGTAPNRILTVQWRNAALKAAPDVRLNAQMRLYETTQRVEMHYGTCSIPTTRGTMSIDVGLRGASSSDIHSRRVSEDIRVTWSNSAESTSSEDACELSATNSPQSGLVFRWSPLQTPRSLSAAPIVRQILLRGIAGGMTSVFEKPHNENAECRVFPNPTADEATVEIVDGSGEAHVSVNNALGTTLLSAKLDTLQWQSTLHIKTNNWAQGVYTIVVSMPHQTLYRRLVVLR